MDVRHPVTGKPFDYERVCNTCVHFTDRTRTNRGVKYRTTRCALDPEERNLAVFNDGVSWKAVPACTSHKRK